ncbi:CMRF35-like molecule 8 isoform X2 [Manis pentadactyla]|uniref:CMRF35-like molecule 8 isoform X2 n=1 Tax=Manis pentadactyla TaxID=143292 RepID=UPI00255D0EA1|nr:CMRF35-like molecule 8 isoform X2 [Manis pentadactyla]
MPRQARAWLPPALLLLWTPGCWSLSGPESVMGTIGGSLSVQCRYTENFAENNKYWCRNSCLSPWKIVETTGSERVGRSGRVSIRDHPANLTFTVTVESLTEGDAGTYRCGIDTPWLDGFVRDPTFQVVVSVIPATTAPPTGVPNKATSSTTTTTTALIAMSSPAPDGGNVTHHASNREEFQQNQGLSLQVLLSLSALLLLLLGGSTLLAWRMVQRRPKGENRQPPQNSSQAAEHTEPCYANLELQMRSLGGQPMQLMQPEVEYSTVRAPREELHYTSVAFDFQRQDSKASRINSQKAPALEPEYSVIKKT